MGKIGCDRSIDLTGQRFGRLVVIRRNGRQRSAAMWLCQCDCGNLKTVVAASMKRGLVVSCGCYHRERARQALTKHGMYKSPEYKTWENMNARCGNPNVGEETWRNYGGRGIRVEWPNFEEFYRDMGPRPTPQHTIERKNNDGNYYKENCVWATRKEQSQNQRPKQKHV